MRDNREIFYRLAKTVRSSICAFRNAQEENILVNGSIKKFFNYARSRMHPSHRIGPIKHPDGTTTINNTERADLFNNFFYSVFVPNDGNSPLFRPRTDKAMPTPIFSVTDIRKSLTASSTSISCGPDGIPPLLLKKFPELCFPLCDLFNMSLQQGCVPKAWKTANIVPIYKGKGSTLEVNNYRPISLTNVFCKTLERLIHGSIVSHLEFENLLSPCQSGFRPGLSTLMQLTHAQLLINDNINQLCCVDGVYTDLSKAFDTISHKKLLLKLQAYGIQGSLLKWIESFLSDRSQSVVINSTLSGHKPCISGIPQGIVLSPLLFIIFINDLPDCIKNSTILLYADDTKLLKPISCCLDCFLLQQDLDAFAAWCPTWQVQLNISKYLWTRFGLAHKPIINYSLSDIELTQVTIINDLGVAFDSKLNFSSHCHRVWQLKGTLELTCSLNAFTQKTDPYNVSCSVFVLPVLLYNSPIWSPHFVKDVVVIEHVQKYFTKNLKGLRDKPYKERLSILKLPTLECHRAYNDLIFLYKIIHGLSDTSLLNMFSPIAYNSNLVLRRHPCQLNLPLPRTNLLKYSFHYCSVKTWNSFPYRICSSPTLASFKKLLMPYLC